MKTVLMVAEKPSLAASLATILSRNSCTTRKGLNGVCTIHEWTGKFQGNNMVRFRMTSVCGHVMSVDFIGKYNNWDQVDPMELFTCQIQKKDANPKLKMPYFLGNEAKGCQYLVLWLDCDKEGENICYEVMNCVSNFIHDVYSPDVTFRAKFSAITENDILYAFNHLVYPNENEAKSVDIRQELDLRIGCAFTRFQTKFFQGRYTDLDASLISYGPCQTPTLGFCVERHDKILTFKPETYWNPQVTIMVNEQLPFKLKWNRMRCFDRDATNMFLEYIKQFHEATVLNCISKRKTKNRPLALNTVELLRAASTGLQMGPHHTMQIAEKLYTQGYISYPRTETTSYSQHFDLDGILRLFVTSSNNNSEYYLFASEVLKCGIHKTNRGHDAGDHPPITPMKLATKNDFNSESWKLYDYIVRHFIASLASDFEYESTIVTFGIDTECFHLEGKRMVNAGYTIMLPWHGLQKEEHLPTFQVNQQIPIIEYKLIENQTSPPDYLSEAELITLMEKHGIGTDASIPVHINNICQRNYVTVTSTGRRLKPTPLGIVLVHGYKKIDNELVLPTMRSSLEQQLNLIAINQVNDQAVLAHTLKIFTLKFQYFVQNMNAMDGLFEVSFSALKTSGRPYCRCGKCRRYMKLIVGKRMRLFCTQCDDTYKLPHNGTIKLYQEQRCPLDDFELLYWTMGEKKYSFILCPYCYNYPPFDDMKGDNGCNSCTHPTCNYSLNLNGVSSCFNCPDGILVLDPGSKPHWKLVCSRCEGLLHLFDGAIQLMVLSEERCNCEAQLVRVKLKDSSIDLKGCIFCSEDMKKYVKQPINIVNIHNRPSKGLKVR